MTGYLQVEEMLSDVIGLDPESIGSAAIKNEVNTLMKTLDIHDVSLYADRLRADKKEMGRLVERIIVPETWFFRDRESYRFLGQHVKEMNRERGSGVIRILSAPCSTGEEPYSITMTLFDRGLRPRDFVVHAVDVSSKALEFAQQGEYGKPSFRGVKGRPDRYFVSRGERWVVEKAILEQVHFINDNILRPGFSEDYGGYHIIFCRNLLIYLNQEGRRRLFECLKRMLLPGGVLFAGHSELASFLQKGYVPVVHPRSFACAGAPEAGAQTREQELIQVKKRSPVKATERIAPRQSFVPESRQGRGKYAVADPGADIVKSPLPEIRRLADRGSLAEASKLCEQYLGTRNPDKEGFYLMGLVSQALGRAERAEEMFMKTLYLDPSHYEALLHMALLREQKGDGSGARIFRQRIKRLEERETAPGRQA